MPPSGWCPRGSDSDHQSLKSKFGYTEDLDHELRDIRSDISGCDDKIDKVEEELGDRIEDTERAIKRLTQHVRLLDGECKSNGGSDDHGRDVK
ncbi:hypothetical protein [Streptomyces sp. NPDC086182]|uniref:hypothetical protein n=1 Tax=Streptomyces sp. NPDC086182 TaxID=3155058 RepID=UPI00341C8135